MFPEICRIGPFTVYSYGFMLAVAFLISASLAAQESKKQRINPDTVFNLLFLSLVIGILGARLFFVLENFGYFFEHPVRIVKLQEGGLSWFGGFFGAVIAGSVYIRIKKLSFLKVFDTVIPFVALGQGIGRIGCFLNGCCYGKESLWGIYFPEHHAVLIPSQIYSSLALIFIFITLKLYLERPHRAGDILFAYCVLYGIKRFFIEFLRADNPVVWAGLTLFQFLSAGLFAVGLAWFIFFRKRIRL